MTGSGQPASRWRSRTRSKAIDLALVALALLDPVLATGPGLSVEFGLSTVAALALLGRRRYPVAVFLLTLPSLFAGASYIQLASMTALFTVAAHTGNRRFTIGFAAILSIGDFYPWPVSDVVRPSSDDLVTLIYSLLIGVAPAALGLLVYARGQLGDQLVALKAEKSRSEELIASGVLATERARIAREMHDVVSHQVSLIAIQAGALRVSTDDPETAASADTIRRLSVKTLTELRDMVGVLRASGAAADELAPQPTLADLPALIAASGVAAAVDLSPGLDAAGWPDSVSRAVYRTIQEGLTNAGKHAPGAAMTIAVHYSDDVLRVEMISGPPTEPVEPIPGGHHGLIGLRERAQLAGGALTAEPTPDGGFRLFAEFPTR